jgi:signal transduction histidine kinase
MSVSSAELPYLLTFLLAVVTSVGVAWWVDRYDEPGTRALAFVLVANGLWALNSAARIATEAITPTRILLSTEMFAAVSAAVIWFSFATEYTDRHTLQDWRVRSALAGLCALALLVPLTDPLHGLMWAEVSRSGADVVIVKGPAHYALTVVAYLVFLSGFYYLAQLLWSLPRSRVAVLSLLVGMLGVGVANISTYVVEMPISHSTTVTPLGATVFAVGAFIAVRYNLFTVVPVARDTVLDTLQDPMLVVSREGHILHANDPFTVTFQTPPATDGSVRFQTAFPDLAADVTLGSEETQTVTVGDDDPRPRHYSVTVSAARSGPHLLGYSLVFRDVTQLTEAKLELERQNAQLDEFAYSAAHNLRNPLGIISGYAGLLEVHLSEAAGESYDSDLAMNSVRKISENAERMEEIVTDFLRVTREGKTAGTLEPISLSEVAGDAFARLDDTESLDHSVGTHGFVYADPKRIGTLLETVFRSARDRADGTASVRVDLTDDGFTVTDTGRYVPPEDAKLLLDYGYTTKYPGTGLGLSVARTLARVHRWHIDIDPTYTDGLRVVVSGAVTLSEEAVIPDDSAAIDRHSVSFFSG